MKTQMVLKRCIKVLVKENKGSELRKYYSIVIENKE